MDSNDTTTKEKCPGERSTVGKLYFTFLRVALKQWLHHKEVYGDSFKLYGEKDHASVMLLSQLCSPLVYARFDTLSPFYLLLTLCSYVCT